MCGIAGFINFNSQKPDLNLLQNMTDLISYRGPDDKGYEINQNAAIGNRRLAIIDLSGKAHMPMWDLKHRFCITYNGEIYNFPELRDKLIKKAYRFRSKSDTEVILNLYIEYKEKSLSMLRGMFSFAIWDSLTNKLFLARDQFGIKPLHYYLDNEVFIFGSEIKSILLHPRVKRQICPQALSQYFSIGFGAVAAPLTIYQQIFKLPAAHWAIIENGRIKISRYWTPSTKTINTDEVSAQEKMTYLIEKSIKQQLISDVPLGSFLSGGIDSSLITALAQKHSTKKINTFSIGFEDPQFDESQHALLVSQQLNTNHHHQIFTAKEMLAMLPEIINKLDEPMADASILPTYLLSKYTKQFVTVALSGDGGDELFLGYPTYIVHKVSNLLNLLPKSLLNTLQQLALNSSSIISKLPLAKHAPNYSINYKIKRLFNGLDRNIAKQYLNVLGPFNLSLKDNLILNHKEAALPYVEELIKNCHHDHGLSIIQLLDFILYLGEDCLVKTDRASNYNSLEVRPPFLDLEITEFALSLPIQLKLHHFSPKYLLKKIASKYLPPQIINRPKKGFGVPLHHWFKNELNSQLHDLLDKNEIDKQGIFDGNYIHQLIREHETGIYDHRMVLWNLFLFESWYKRWMN